LTLIVRARSMFGMTFDMNSWSERITTSGDPEKSTFASPYVTDICSSLSLDRLYSSAPHRFSIRLNYYLTATLAS